MLCVGTVCTESFTPNLPINSGTCCVNNQALSAGYFFCFWIWSVILVLFAGMFEWRVCHTPLLSASHMYTIDHTKYFLPTRSLVRVCMSREEEDVNKQRLFLWLALSRFTQIGIFRGLMKNIRWVCVCVCLHFCC